MEMADSEAARCQSALICQNMECAIKILANTELITCVWSSWICMLDEAWSEVSVALCKSILETVDAPHLHKRATCFTFKKKVQAKHEASSFSQAGRPCSEVFADV